jgi:hypothetical protein
MRAFAFSLLCLGALVGGCRGYSLDMSGLDTYADGQARDAASSRWTMSDLDRASSCHVEPAGRGLTMSDADAATSSSLDETNRRLSMSRLERLSTKHVEPTGDGLSISDLERVTSRRLDPDNNKIR